MTRTNKTLFIAAAGTGGHVFPALAVAEAAQEKGFEIVWFGTASGLENKILQGKPYTLIQLPARGMLGKSISHKIKSALTVIRSIQLVKKQIKNSQPIAVIVFGGYIAYPVGIAAKQKKVPLYIHEQNTVPGMSNRLLAKVANKVFCGLPCEFANKQINFVGNPLRHELKSYQKAYGAHKQLRVLFMGGSQGASILNETLLAMLTNENVPSHFQFWLQCGVKNLQSIEPLLKPYQKNVKVTAFIDDIKVAYDWADIIVCRAGAMTVSELIAVALPAIFIPLPQATHNHQFHNASYMISLGAAMMLEQKDLSSQKLLTTLKALSAQKLQELQQPLLKAAKNKAAQQIVETILQDYRP